MLDADPSDPDNDRPELIFNTSVEAFASLNAGLAKAGVGGGIYGNVNFDLNDPTPGDGKIRYSELLASSLFNSEGEDLFRTSGGLSAGLSAYLKVGFGLFSYTKRFDSPRQVLLDFGGGIDPFSQPQFVLATPLEEGILRLNMGPNAADRLIKNTEDGPEIFTVKRSGTQGNAVSISAFNEFQVVEDVSKIIANGGAENDVINLETTLPSELSGGDGLDELVGGLGRDVLRGEGESDRLFGGGQNDQLFGGSDDDLLDGGAGADVLDGGEGFDVVSYETAEAGIFLNRLTGQGSGDAAGDTFISIEQINGSSYDDTLIGGNDSDRFDGGTGNDTLRGGGGDDALLPGYGDDMVSGGGGDDLLVIDYSHLPTAAVVWRQSNPAVPKEAALFVANAYGMGTPLQQIHPYQRYTLDVRDLDRFAVSADGSTIVWENNDLFVQIGREVAPIALGLWPQYSINSFDPISVSADGHKVAFIGRDQDNNTDGIFVAKTDGSEVIQVLDIAQEITDFPLVLPEPAESNSTAQGFSQIALSGDGSKVAWTRKKGSLLSDSAAYMG